MDLKHKKILIVSHVLVRYYKGRYYVKGTFGRHVDAFAKRFRQVFLLTCVTSQQYPVDDYCLRSKNIQILGTTNFWHPNRIVRFVRRIFSMIIAAKEVFCIVPKIDLIHLRLPSPIAFICLIITKIVNKPVFIFLAGDREKLLLLKGKILWPLAKLYHLSLKLLTKGKLCFAVGKDLAVKLGGPSDRIIPVVDVALEAKHFIRENDALKNLRNNLPVKILYVGAVNQNKGVDILLSAVKLLKSKGYQVRLRIVGRIEGKKNWFLKMVDSLSLNNYVDLVGYLSWEKVIYEYNKNDIFVLPSRCEGIPNVILEAMARGIPVIATDVGDISSLVIHLINGILVKSTSPISLAKALEYLINHYDVRKKLIKNGLKTVKRYTLSKLIELMLNKVEEILLIDSPN